MGYVPEEIIAQVLDRSDIVAVISSYLALKPAGRNFKGLCPFHHEKTPSFMVNPDKQIFHCFGCGAGGNVISFVMQQERMEFPEALRFLAAKAGVEVPENGARRDTRAPQLRQQLKKLNGLAAEYFHNQLLMDKGALAQSAREYLQSRGITLAAVKQFRLGFAPDKWSGLFEFLQKRDVPAAMMEKAGLIIAKTGGGFYDRFRKRIIFPIFDSKGESVAFGGRALPGDDDTAKYLNSPETPLYIKGEHLYGFNWAKESVGREDAVVVVEGYMDFVIPFFSGVGNIVASLGTALTTEQIRLIRRYTHNLVMLYDADPAGQMAMLRSLDNLIAEDMNVKVATLTEGDDPDSFVRKFGVPEFRERIKNADSLFDFKLKFLLKKFSGQSVESRAQISAQMLPTISRFKNAVVKTEYVKKLAQALMLSPEALAQELERLKSSPEFSGSREQNGNDVAKTSIRVVRAVEENLVRVILMHKEFIPLARAEADLRDFQDDGLRRIIARVFELFDRGQEFRVADLMGSFTEADILNLISALLAVDDHLVGDKKKIYQDCIQRLRQDRDKIKRQTLRQEMEQARIQGDHLRLEELSKEFNQLIKTKG